MTTTFAYRARDQQGQIRQGELAAEERTEAARQLRGDGLVLLELEAKKSGRTTRQTDGDFIPRRIRRADVVAITTQLSVMIGAGVQLGQALESLADQCEHPRLKTILSDVQARVHAGEDFSAAIARYPKQFDATYVNLVRASEASGTLATMLARLAEQTQADLETRRKVRAAMIYPLAMLTLCIAVCVFLLAYVFPKLAPMFAARQVAVPRPTQVLMAMSDAVVNHWFWVIVAAFSPVVFLLWARRQAWGRSALDRFWLAAPIIGPMVRKLVISRSIKTLSTTINAGVPILDSLRLAEAVAGNKEYEEKWHDVALHVETGKPLHECLQGDPLFPPTLVQMIASGESTGQLGSVLDKAADYYDRELDASIKSATNLLEPLMVFVMGGVIGIIALAMLLPIFKLSGAH